MQIGTRFPALDKGYVELVQYMGDDSMVVRAARQSTGKGFIGWEPYQRCDTCATTRIGLNVPEDWRQELGTESSRCTKHKMIKYPQGDFGLMDKLWRARHTTPFEMGGELVLEVYAPIMVFREWHRHRTQSFNEFSARYAKMKDEHYVPEKWRIQKQSQINKQGSGDAYDEEFAMTVIAELENQQHYVFESYDTFCEQGLAKEVARLNTPVSRYSLMWAKTDLLNWLKFLNLRMRPTAQYEIRQYAEIVGQKIIKVLWGRTWELFEEYDLHGAHFGRTELNLLQAVIQHVSDEGNLQQALERFLLTAETPLTKTKQKEFVQKLVDASTKIIG